MSKEQEKQEREKNAKKYLLTAASYIGKGNKYKNSADRAKSEEKAEEYKKWAKSWYEEAKEKIATTKKMQNMSYNEEKVYDILKSAVKKRKDGDGDAIEKAVKKIIKEEK